MAPKSITELFASRLPISRWRVFKAAPNGGILPCTDNRQVLPLSALIVRSSNHQQQTSSRQLAGALLYEAVPLRLGLFGQHDAPSSIRLLLDVRIMPRRTHVLLLPLLRHNSCYSFHSKIAFINRGIGRPLRQKYWPPIWRHLWSDMAHQEVMQVFSRSSRMSSIMSQPKLLTKLCPGDLQFFYMTN